MGLFDRVTFTGERVSRRHRDIIREAARAVGIDPAKVVVTQGSGSSGSLSGGTHAGRTGAADIRVWNLPADKVVPFCVEMRRRGAGATWPRTRRFGWYEGDHIHSLDGVGDSVDDPNLSESARRQVELWKAGRNGLANNGIDPISRPRVWPTARWSRVGLGKRGDDVLLVQRALARYVGLDYSTGPGVWGAKTQAAWLRAAAKSGRTGSNLFSLLGARYGFRAAP